jgi:hypothetical protein
MDGLAYHQKTDIFKRVMWYSYDPHSAVNITVVPIDRVKEIIEMNKQGKKPDTLLVNDKNNAESSSYAPVTNDNDYKNAVGDDAINRFDKTKRKKKKKKSNNNNNNNGSAPQPTNNNAQPVNNPQPKKQVNAPNAQQGNKRKNKNNNNNAPKQQQPPQQQQN